MSLQVHHKYLKHKCSILGRVELRTWAHPAHSCGVAKGLSDLFLDCAAKITVFVTAY